MKKQIFITAILITGIFCAALGQTKNKFDNAVYEKLAKKTIAAVISGKIDAKQMLSDLEKMVAMGIAGCKVHINKKGTPAEEKKIMKLVVEHADKMAELTLEQIEEQWHEGGVLKENDIDIDKYEHFSVVMCRLDAVVHPATGIICVNDYKKSKDDELLEQIKAELEEVVEHLKHIK